jgi:toxin FitB
VKGFLLDTNIPSEMTRPRPAPQVQNWLYQVDDTQLFISVISIAEIIRGITRLPGSARRNQLQQWLDETLRPWFEDRILPVTQPVAERLGRWAGEEDSKGRALPMADGLIAATALEYDLTLVTRNVKDFSGLSVPLFNPWDLNA